MSDRWLRCGAAVVTPDGIQTVSTYEINGPLVWTEDEYGKVSMWTASALRPLEPVSYREHARVVEARDRLRAEAQQLRDRMRRLDPGAFVLASDVAEALGDMLEEP